jgi:hypothetical protein
MDPSQQRRLLALSQQLVDEKWSKLSRKGPGYYYSQHGVIESAAATEELALLGGPKAVIGLGRNVALHHRASILYQIH